MHISNIWKKFSIRAISQKSQKSEPFHPSLLYYVWTFSSGKYNLKDALLVNNDIYQSLFNPRIHTPGENHPKQESDFGSNMVLLFFLAQDPYVILKNPKKT